MTNNDSHSAQFEARGMHSPTAVVLTGAVVMAACGAAGFHYDTASTAASATTAPSREQEAVEVEIYCEGQQGAIVPSLAPTHSIGSLGFFEQSDVELLLLVELAMVVSQ